MAPEIIRIMVNIEFILVLIATLNSVFCHIHKPESGNAHEVTEVKVFLTEKVAKSFLNPRHRVRRGNNPQEECSEAGGCSWEEVKEFYGNNHNTIIEFTREFKCGSDCQYDSDTYCELTTTSWNEINEVQYRCSRAGGWGTWYAWIACPVTCGTGNRQRRRICDNPTPLGGGANCIGEFIQNTPCVLTACPVDGAWGNWGAWSACSVTCDSGTQFRNRSCDNPEPSNGGIDCPGQNRLWKQCTMVACPVHGGWASWKSWSSCALVKTSVQRTRCRTCTNPVPENGGNICPDRRIQSELCDIPKSALRRPCRCPISRAPVIQNISLDELEELVNDIKEELGVDVSKLSKTIRKKISVKDTRSSAETIGVVGAVMLVIPLSMIVGLDLLSVCRFLKQGKVTFKPEE